MIRAARIHVARLSLAGSVLAAALLGAFPAAVAHAASHTVLIEGFTFKPPALDVKPGDTVEFVNRDIVPHTATASNAAFDSKTIPAGGRWTWTVKAPGRYAYECAFHPNMKGVLSVR